MVISGFLQCNLDSGDPETTDRLRLLPMHTSHIQPILLHDQLPFQDGSTGSQLLPLNTSSVHLEMHLDLLQPAVCKGKQRKGPESSEVQLGRPVVDAKLHLELLEAGHLLARFQTQGRPLRVVLLLPDPVLHQIGLAMGVVLQLQAADGGQARWTEIGEESLKDGLRADDKSDLLIEKVMSFLMDLFARQEQSCQPRLGFDLWPFGESSVGTAWLGRATSSCKRF